MFRINNLQAPLNATSEDLKKLTIKKINRPDVKITNFSIAKKAVDARNKNNVHFVYSIDFEAEELQLSPQDKDIELLPAPEILSFKIKNTGIRPIVIGSGPAGMFAGIALAEAGLNPIIIERGSEVDVRRQEVDIFLKNF